MAETFVSAYTTQSQLNLVADTLSDAVSDQAEKLKTQETRISDCEGSIADIEYSLRDAEHTLKVQDNQIKQIHREIANIEFAFHKFEKQTILALATIGVLLICIFAYLIICTSV